MEKARQSIKMAQLKARVSKGNKTLNASQPALPMGATADQSALPLGITATQSALPVGETAGSSVIDALNKAKVKKKIQGEVSLGPTETSYTPVSDYLKKKGK